VKLKLNGPHQLLVYADDVNLLEDNINITSKITEDLLYFSKEVRLDVNIEKTKHILLICHWNAKKNLYI
jgi:hypothetical protein